jgi:hypothetical protein
MMKKLIAITILSIVITFPVYAQSIGGWSGSGIPTTYLDTDGTLTANSDVKVATQKATKTYADGKQANLSLVKGTYTNGYICTYTSSGTLLDCNTNPATYQAALDLVKGTYADGGYCKYTASGTLIDCNSILGTDFPGISGTITDEQLLCGENTDGTNKIKSCGAKTTDNSTASHAIYKDSSGYVADQVLTIDAHAASTTITLIPGICPIIHNASQADSNINNTLPAVGAGKCFVALATSVEADKYWRLTAAAANTVCLNRTCGKDYIQFDTPAVGDTFTCISDGTNWYCYDYDSSATAGDL